ncbi:MAG: hypothetical protein WBE68_23700 [Candidatus Nitrosopolaris sp.]|jgi:hypothetical protein
MSLNNNLLLGVAGAVIGAGVVQFLTPHQHPIPATPKTKYIHFKDGYGPIFKDQNI